MGLEQMIREGAGTFKPRTGSFMQFIYSLPGGYFPPKKRWQQRKIKRTECKNRYHRKEFIETRKQIKK